MIHFILCSNFTFRSIDFHNKLIAEWREIQILHKYRADSTADHTMNVQWGLVWTNSVKMKIECQPVRYFTIFGMKFCSLNCQHQSNCEWRKISNSNWRKLFRYWDQPFLVICPCCGLTRSFGTPSLTGWGCPPPYILNAPDPVSAGLHFTALCVSVITRLCLVFISLWLKLPGNILHI